VSESRSGGHKIVVLKMGGSVLTGSRAFRRAAMFLKRHSESVANERLVVVVSAQKLATDQLERQAQQIIGAPDARSLDLLWSTGELRSVALLTLHLQAAGVSSVGLNVHETGLQFFDDDRLRSARCLIAGDYLRTMLVEHSVVVVPGFLAIRSSAAIVSLGRGGADLSAVLMAINLNALRCELIKDVPGYFEEDPHKNKRSVHLPSLSFEDALRMAECGCELVQSRALEAAAQANLPLLIRSMGTGSRFSVISSSGCAEHYDSDAKLKS